MPLLLCDLDNTLVDRAGAFARWASDFAGAHGQDESFASWLVELDAEGHRLRTEMFAAVQARLGLAESVDELIERYYGQYLSCFRPDGRVDAALEAARASGWRIAIVSNGSGTQLEKIRRAGLDRLVDAWCVSEIEGFEKPDPGLLILAAQRCGESLADAWVIGDNPDTDIAAAQAAMLPSVWLHRGRVWPRPDYSPTHQAASFTEAVDLVLGSTTRPEVT